MRSRTKLLILGVLATLISPDRVSAAPIATIAATKQKLALFDIPAQPLVSALQAYSVVTGYEVLCDSRLAAGQRSTAVIGLFTPQTALRILLDATDLSIRYNGPQDITLVATERPRPSLPNGAPPAAAVARIDAMTLDTLYVDVPENGEHRPDFVGYGRGVRMAIRNALARDAETTRRIFDLQIDIWIDRNGQLYRSHLLGSTGRTGLDAALQRVLHSTPLPAPPAGLPQPVRIAVVAF